jgi:hypothetical protein
MQSTELLRNSATLVERPPTDYADRVVDRELAAISCGFQLHGGLATADEVVRLMRPRTEQPISTMARWIVDRNVVHFAWRGATLLPLFQFDRGRMQPNAIVICVMQELRDIFDDWEIALWFVTPNACTNDVAPVVAFGTDPSATLAAARTDRFVALGL